MAIALATEEDDPSLTDRVTRLEADMKWLKKIVLKDHYLIISTLIAIILALLGIVAVYLRG